MLVFWLILLIMPGLLRPNRIAAKLKREVRVVYWTLHLRIIVNILRIIVNLDLLNALMLHFQARMISGLLLFTVHNALLPMVCLLTCSWMNSQLCLRRLLSPLLSF
jgi:hypothetical protein